MSALTTASGVNYTKYTAGGMANFVTQQWGTGLECVHDEYTVPTGDTLAVAGVLTMGIVPKGARVLFHVITYTAAGAAATGTIKVGTTTSGSVTTMVAAGSQVIGSLIASSGTATTADSAVTLTIADQDLDAAVNVTLTTVYIQDGIGA